MHQISFFLHQTSKFLTPHLLSSLHKFSCNFSTSNLSEHETIEQKKARAAREAIEQFQRIDQSFKLREGGRDINPDEDIEFIEYSPRVKMILRICGVMFWGTVSVLGYNYYLVKTKKSPLQYPLSQPHLQKYSLMIEQKCNGIYNFFTKPPIKSLLPGFPDIPGFQPPKTLVVTLEGTLVHSDYVLGKGMILNLRPGVIEILQKLKYEIVIYSNEDAQFIETCVQYLDPQRQIFSAAFGKESTVFSYHGSYIDLKYLGRQLNQIIAISNDPKLVQLQPENSIVINPFKGNGQDKVLYELANLLEYLSRSEVKDVRKELMVLGNQDRVSAFNKAVQEKKTKLAQSKGIGNFMSKIAKQNHSNFQTFR